MNIKDDDLVRKIIFGKFYKSLNRNKNRKEKEKSMLTFQEDLKKAIDYHGHLCSGQILGVRMARMALSYFKIEDPKNYRDLIVYVECDRCLADAIGIVTGCNLGRRRLKWMDYGKIACSFLDLKTKKAIRIVRIGHQYPQEGEELVEFFEQFVDEQLFQLEEVEIPIEPWDLPGKPISVAVCEMCNEEILDHREVLVDGHIFCKGCHQGNYYRKKE